MLLSMDVGTNAGTDTGISDNLYGTDAGISDNLYGTLNRKVTVYRCRYEYGYGYRRKRQFVHMSIRVQLRHSKDMY